MLGMTEHIPALQTAAIVIAHVPVHQPFSAIGRSHYPDILGRIEIFKLRVIQGDGIGLVKQGGLQGHGKIPFQINEKGIIVDHDDLFLGAQQTLMVRLLVIEDFPEPERPKTATGGALPIFLMPP